MPKEYFWCCRWNKQKVYFHKDTKFWEIISIDIKVNSCEKHLKFWHFYHHFLYAKKMKKDADCWGGRGFNYKDVPLWNFNKKPEVKTLIYIKTYGCQKCIEWISISICPWLESLIVFSNVKASIFQRVSYYDKNFQLIQGPCYTASTQANLLLFDV